MLTSFPYTALRGFCRRIYGDIGLLLTPTVYNLEFGAVLATAQSSRTVPINANSDFILTGLAYNASAACDGLFSLTDSSNSLTLSSSPVPLSLIADFFGSIEYGSSLHYPYWIGRNSAFLGQYIGQAVGDRTNLTVSLIGLQVRELV